MLGAAVALSSGFESASAEGFFQKLFGWGSSRRSERIAPPTFNFDEDPIVTEPAYDYKPAGSEVIVG